MNPYTMIDPNVSETYAMQSHSLPKWDTSRMKTILAALVVGATLIVAPAARGGNPELPVDLLSAAISRFWLGMVSVPFRIPTSRVT